MATMRPALRVVCILIARLGTRTGMYHSLVRICPSTVESFLKVSPRAVHSPTACPRLSSNSRALPLNVALITWASWASMVRLALSEHDGAHNESLMHSCNTNQPAREDFYSTSRPSRCDMSTAMRALLYMHICVTLGCRQPPGCTETQCFTVRLGAPRKIVITTRSLCLLYLQRVLAFDPATSQFRR